MTDEHTQDEAWHVEHSPEAAYRLGYAKGKKEAWEKAKQTILDVQMTPRESLWTTCLKAIVQAAFDDIDLD